MSKFTRQLEYACEEMFLDGPMSKHDIVGILGNADTVDYIFIGSAGVDGVDEIIVTSGTKQAHLAYFNRNWLHPENSGGHGVEKRDFDNAVELADHIARGGWKIIHSPE